MELHLDLLRRWGQGAVFLQHPPVLVANEYRKLFLVLLGLAWWQEHAFRGQNQAKIVKNRGPGAFQQQSGSEQGPEVKKDPKSSNPPVWDPF